ncbi:VOC family protein [Methylobacterium durans]|uniref:Lactoylglutathione lyase n=1 Tax=Methylobacterium durans TaxID=2202825 RepID=A0A2U8WFT1_9HYPH|nr:VOC family protein [Methylobacterium durans]AWN44899.1 lactoylglutathione lyase [Methylobacterium durans]
MPQMIFVNLPVRDVAKSTAFYEAVGATKNPNFSNDDASCMVFSDVIHAMLLSHAFFGTFTTKTIPDARETCQVLICISQESREAVDAMVARAEAAGGRPDPGPKQDYGFMYGRSFEDPDGHVWEISWMDPVAAAKGPEAYAAGNG